MVKNLPWMTDSQKQMTFHGRQSWVEKTFNERQPLMEHKLWWKKTFNVDDLLETSFNGRQCSMDSPCHYKWFCLPVNLLRVIFWDLAVPKVRTGAFYLLNWNAYPRLNCMGLEPYFFCRFSSQLKERAGGNSDQKIYRAQNILCYG